MLLCGQGVQPWTRRPALQVRYSNAMGMDNNQKLFCSITVSSQLPHPVLTRRAKSSNPISLRQMKRTGLRLGRGCGDTRRNTTSCDDPKMARGHFIYMALSLERDVSRT